MRRTILSAVLGSLMLASAVQVQAQDQDQAQDTVTLGITQIVEHPALDASRQGVLDELKARGYIEDDNLDVIFENAQGDTAIAAQIARKFAGEPPTVLLAISTPTAQSAAAVMPKTAPIVFTAVTDPLLAKLVADMDSPGANITGVVDAPPLKAQLQLIREMFPEAESLGVIYNPGEANSVSQVEALETLAPDMGFTLVDVTASRTSEVMGAARSLAGRADAIYVPVDNTVVSALESVVRVGYDADIPVFTGDNSSVARGALASLGFSYYDMGRQTGEMVARIIDGEDPGNIPVGTVEKLELIVNSSAAEAIGYEIPAELQERAVEIIE
ncbi:ABC transporter substrate-binding protein [Halomonas halocynthiae]|uniref:ABC transporter substrate-binding protein n=1 Tax=Halomonas halocynthiae TaxID=176290 RepID=UPI0003F59054|nr:ABC transporter substrate-binding protein [Halomonas halocynthiae]